MTTFQDPPPQSRRSARQSERGEPSPFVDQQPFIAPQTPPPAAPSTGRRARPAAADQAVPVPEPLNYTTQGQYPVSYEQQPSPTAYTAPPAGEPTTFRVRDFSPEGSGRRAASPPPLIEPQQQGYPAGASDLDYRTQGAPTAVPTPPAPAAPTLSRREMRQRQAETSELSGAQPLVSPPANPALYTQPPQPANPALLTQPPQPVNPALLTQPPQLQTAPPPQSAPPQQMPTQAAPPSMAPATTTAPPTALSNAMAEFEALTRNGQPPAPSPRQRVTDAPVILEPEVESSGGWVAPVGHWSRQADLDDETQPWENTITREVGGGNVATTTSALVLPEIPRPTAFSTALDSTGEVLLTGSIDLPPSLSTGGGDSRRYDDPNVDLMFDTQDAEFTGTDSSPVRAIRAVSTHTSSRGVIHANKPHGNRMIVVVFVVTAALAVGVVGMLIASLALNLF